MSPVPKKLPDRVREIIRLKHYSRKTEKTYVSWIRRFVRDGKGMKDRVTTPG